MGEQSHQPASAPTGAVFLSYASQDADAARRICDALRAAGIEVWFDQSELRGGDAWDQSIRNQIKTCALFLPVISKHTHERAEGYFRVVREPPTLGTTPAVAATRRLDNASLLTVRSAAHRPSRVAVA
jgi:hypothetical protein